MSWIPGYPGIPFVSPFHQKCNVLKKLRSDNEKLHKEILIGTLEWCSFLERPLVKKKQEYNLKNNNIRPSRNSVGKQLP